MLRTCVLALFCGIFFTARVFAAPYIELPQAGITPDQLAVVYLQGDKNSEAIARYYAAQRNIPSENLFSIKFDSNKTSVSVGEFAVQYNILAAKLAPSIQGILLSWAQPYRVDCMSISAAFAFGFNPAFCASGCEKTRATAYYHSGSTAPFTDFRMRPTMMLAADNLSDAFALINRGVEADDTQPIWAHSYLLKTSDKNRTVREVYFDQVQKNFDQALSVNIVEADSIQNKQDVLFYFTGLKFVDDLESIQFLPGAMADHLTSHGGRLTDSSQMSAMRWLQAGATGSYGTAHEPCNFLEKFPQPAVAMWHYLRGESLLESYWKSVRMPGQGNFIGEPLAAPFKGYRLIRKQNRIEVHSPVFKTGGYKVFDNTFSDKSYSIQQVTRFQPFIILRPPYGESYKIERL